jgi:PAS domain S-box-containing protein
VRDVEEESMKRGARPPPVDDTALAARLHTLEVERAELVLQNYEQAANIAELRRNNVVLAAAHEHWRALHELAPAPLITIDADGVILEINHAGEVALGAPRAQLIERRLLLFIAEAGRPAASVALRDLFTVGAAHAVELVLSPGGGEPVEVVVDGVVLSGVPGRALLAFTDITAYRRTQETHHLDSLGVLAGGVAHAFSNLLTVVLGGTEHALRTLDAGSTEAAALRDVRQAAYQAGALAQQMKASSGRPSVALCATDLGALLRDLTPALRRAAGTAPLSVEVAAELPWIMGDAAQLRDLVLNLVTNAAEAIGDRTGTITLTARIVAPASVGLEVKDDGAGMDALVQARAFEPYFTTKFAGRGLGLSVVRGVVRSHHGKITVTSAPARGTTFRVYFSAVATPEPPAHVEAPSPRAGQVTVLVVDDEPRLRSGIRRVLEARGMTVITAADGIEALEAFRARAAQIDLVVMDLTMPRMGGIAAGEMIHDLRPELPIILISGYGEVPAAARDVFATLLVKPFGFDALVQVIKTLLPAPSERGRT